MPTFQQAQINTYQQNAPDFAYNTTAASGTYQASAANMHKLHVITCTGSVYLLAGTGASVTVTSSTGAVLLTAGATYYFHPRSDKESIGWVAATGTPQVLIGIVSE